MLPNKAISEIDLAEHPGAAPASSGHAVTKINFVKDSGLSGLGFLKYCDPTYCVLHAKYVVGLSVLYRSSLGNKASEERLVYDVENKVVGTASVAIPNFVPMQNITEALSSDSEINSLANPTPHTLILKNIAEQLVASWRHKDDDLHPGNISTEGRIDFDMSWYNHISSVLKGQRVTSGNLQTTPALGTILQEEDLYTFPILKSNRTHWPSHAMPENGNALKIFKAQSSFSELSQCEKFREQMFTALLKELLSFQRLPLRARLKSQLGNENINLDSLNSSNTAENKKKEELLSLLDPDLFYTKGHKKVPREKSFVEHFLSVAEQEFSSFYKVVVNYNEFNNYISKHPESYLEVRDFFVQENKKYPTEEQHEIEEMDRMFQQIWRDSSVSKVLQLLGNTEELFDKLQKDINTTLFFSASTTINHQNPKPSKHVRGVPEKMSPIDSNAAPQKIRNAIGELYSKLYQTSLIYFNRQEPSIENNTKYIDNCTIHINEIQKQLTQIYCSDTTKFSKQSRQTNSLLSSWKKMLNELSYPHQIDSTLARKSPSMRYVTSRKSNSDLNKHIILDHNIDSILTASFATWLNNQKVNDLIVDINIALKEYKPQWSLTSMFSSGRTDRVKDILNNARRGVNPNSTELLESILFADGGGWGSGSLNTIIMKTLIQKMLPDITSNVESSANYTALSKFKAINTRESFDILPHILNIKNELQLQLQNQKVTYSL